ncbi:MAG: hypothetical protein E7215_17150 [Clostridium sulfidigenes]|uniref:Uncharacterized protein n=1 Tax=Clostridium sulfidigenes TaxID=318464 RepID=A0A927WDP3_9CLOT|nr:hypothetical protein [Clostridium sulfidigenes]
MVDIKGFELSLQNYCSHCGDFEAEVETLNCSSLGEPNKYINHIRCENAERCEKLYKHLKGDGVSMDENPPAHEEQTTECDICARLSECIKESKAINITIKFDNFNHYMPGLDGCPKWRD